MTDSKAAERVTILVADDEPTLLLVAAAVLSRSGYKVLTAANGEEALETFENAEHTIHLVISDFAMPGMNGYQFVRLVQKLSPSTPVMLVSGSWPLVAKCGVPSIAKPFTHETLISQARALLEKCDFSEIEREQTSLRCRLRAAHANWTG